ncbi:UNVERIFIED_CONTAM: hypothetical protein Slati_3103600 [Sesamum latifolium]|uniref:Uncharacterized protein n=1 Tax=Sesamum latifolium TaxID=2727402 RepID=A0AAW2UUZ8_9LAMI
MPSATQEVKTSAFSQGLLEGDFFKSLAKKPVSKFDAHLARAAKYINMETLKQPRRKGEGKNKGSEGKPPPRSVEMNFERRKLPIKE